MKKVLMIIPPYLQEAEEKAKNVPSTRMRSVSSVPMGALSVMTYNQDIAEFHLLDCNLDATFTLAPIKFAMACLPDIVGISMTFDSSWKYIKDIVRTISVVMPDTPIVIGGAATIPEQTYRTILEETSIDAVCFGEGELPFRDLIQNMSLKGLSWITRESLSLGALPWKTKVGDLDKVIELDYSYLDINNYSMQEESLFVETNPNDLQFYVETSRGCPFKCSFCYYSRDKDRGMRYASVEKVIDYVRKLKESYGMTVLSISDDQFLYNKNRAKEIFRQLAQFNLRVEILQGTSVGFIDEEMVRLMKMAGVVRVTLPIESGCQEVLDKMVEKPVDLDKAKEVIKLLRKYGMWATALFVMGFPGETDTHRAETMQWIEGAGLDWCTFSAAIPIWGTKLYDLCVEKGYIRNDIKLGEMDFSNYFINVPGYPPEYVTRQIYVANLYHNFVNNYQMRQGDYTTAARAFRKVIDMYPNQAFAHYYLAECLNHLGMVGEAIYHEEKFKKIVTTDIKWLEYAQLLGMGG